MHSILVLTAVFAMMVTYLENNQPKQGVFQQPAIVKVIRSPRNQPIIEQEAIIVASPAQKPPAALNLTLPSLERLQQHYAKSKSSVMNLFKANDSPEITYNAELIYDAESGEDITGGKVNITIPFG